MTIKQIYDFLNIISPFDTQEKWDNSGIIVGNPTDTFEHIYISLDLDTKMLKKVKKGSLIITHHPLIFSPLKKINFDNYSTKLLKILLKKKIKLIAMHTNIDKSHLNKFVANDILGFQCNISSDFIQIAKVNISFKKLLKIVKQKLNLKTIKYVKSKETIHSVAITTGAGMSLLSTINADCFLTGDIKYHEAMDAKEQGINLIDIGHYESEIFFSDILEKLLKDFLKENNLQYTILNSQNPFQISR